MEITQTKGTTVTGWVRRGLIAGVVVAPLFVVTDLVDGLLRPDYSLLRHWVSHRALGEYGWIATLSLAICALLLLGCAFSLFAERQRTTVKSAYPIVLFVAAVGLLVAALFPMDPSLGFPPGTDSTPTQSVSGAIHDVAGPVFILGLAVAAFLTRRFLARVTQGSLTTRLGWVAGAVIILSFVLTSVLVSLDYAGVLPGAWSGLFERIAIYIGLCWIARVCYRRLTWTADRALS
jgi:hypothetical protein